MQAKCHMSVLVHEQAKKYGDREMLIYQDFGGKEWKSLSWNQVSATVMQVSNALLNLGVKVQENIGIFSQNSVQYIECDFGAWGIRAVTIPFYATSSEQQIQFMVNDAKIRYLFVGEQDQYDKARRIFSLCPTMERIIVFDPLVKISTHDPNAIYFNDFLKLGENLPRQTEVEKLQQDRIMNFLPYTHIFERGWAILCLYAGAKMIVNTHPQEVQQSMRDTHPTCMSAVPRFWEKVYMGVMDKIEHASGMQRRLFKHALSVGRRHNIEYLSKGKKPPITLHLEYEMLNRTVFSLVRKELGLENAHFFPTAGAAVSAFVEEFVHSIGINMVVGYGLTESLATVSCDHLGNPYTVGSVGIPIEGIDIKISEEGEILLKGPTITIGYYNREDLTKQSFTADGYFRTGDAGYLKDGELFLTERIKDLFKTSNGKYIAPQMIESKLLVDKYIDQICIIADQRKFVSALIVPVYSLLEEYAREHGIAFDNREQLCANPRIIEMMHERIDTLQQQLAHYEQVKRFTLLPHHLSMEKGELTNTLKIKRRVLNENYKEQIDAMYAE